MGGESAQGVHYQGFPACMPGRCAFAPLGNRSAGTVFAFIRGQQRNRRHGRYHTREERRQAMQVKTKVKAGGGGLGMGGMNPF